MKVRHGSTFVRLGVAALLAAPIAIGLLPAGPPAGATTALPFDTKFEIDGNPQVDSTGDWLSSAAEYPELRDNFVTTTEPCGGGSDPNRFVPGTKLDQINVNNAAPFIQSGNVLTKGDVCAVRRAWELVLVPQDPTDPAAGGQYHYISYLAWSRVTTNGEINVLIPLLGTDPNSQFDDVIVDYDFVDNTQTTTLSFLRWNGSTWVENPLPAGTYEAVTAEGVTDPAVPAPQGTNLTFGEYAIDLTAAGLLPEFGPCATFSNGALASRTGNSPQATLEDAVALPPLTLTNCSSLNIVKQTTPTPTSPTAFGFNVHQVDGAQLQPGITEIDDSITVPPNPNTTTINNLLISPDYVVAETTLPPGWTEQSLVCTSFDPLTGQSVTRTLYNGTPGPDASFPLGPNVAATCTITNIGPPSVTLTKTVDPASATGWSFDFTISPATGVTPGATQTVTSAAPSITWDNLTNGVQYTITETGVAAGYQAGTISCNEGGNTFTPEAGQTIICEATNQQLARLTVVKDAAPADDEPFDFEVYEDGNLLSAGVLADPSFRQAVFPDLSPGSTFTITEILTDAQITAGWKAVSVVCIDALDGAVVQGTVSATGGTVDVTSQPGSDISCAFSNAQGGSITIQKTANPVGTPQDFPFTVTGPAGAPFPAMPILLDVDSDPTNPATTTIGNLPPGTYTVSEATPAGWLLTNFSCGVGTPDPATGTITFTVTEGQNVVCSYVNTQLATVSLTKSVDPPTTTTPWSFSFTISPAPAGETATKVATNAAPTVGWIGLVPGTAYTITEGPAPAGFQNGSIDCDGDATFTPAPGETVTCTVTNVELANASVTKTVQGAADWAFDFTISPDPDGDGGQPATQTATDEDATVTWTGLDPSVAYTVTETQVGGFITGTLTCTGGTNAVGTSTFTPLPGQAVTCAVTNTALASVDVTKTVQGAADWAFDFTISPDPDGDGGQPATQTATDEDDTVTWTGLDPFVQYTITEAAEPGFINGSINCDGDAAFTPTPGETVACAVTNIALASVDVTKTVAGSAAAWAFDFTISPVPAGETATKSATNSAPTVGWDGLVPGSSYTVTEANAAGFITGTLTCTGGTSGSGTSTFTPTPGQAVTCAITNDVVVQLPPSVADIAVVKTAAPTVVTPGGNVTWTLVARNNGPDAADNVVIVDNLPSTLTLVSFTSPAGWDCSGTVTGNPGKLSCTKPTMGLNESATFTLTTTVAAAAAGTTIDNTAVVSTSTNESTTSNNQDAEPISVQVAVLPPTGGYVWDRIAVAAGLVLVGFALVAIDRRRRFTS